MFSSKPRGPRIVYVAASARELPAEVQQWLGRAEHRAASSPHIYDALALLASGAKPAVMIVSIEAVDWSEMVFFDQAARLSRDTRVFVTGHDYQAAKLDAACKRGAGLFDEDAAAEALAAPTPWSRGAGMSDILAARLRPVSQAAFTLPAIKPVPPVAVEEEEAQEDTELDAALADEDTNWKSEPQGPATEPAPPAEQVQAPPVRLVDVPEPEAQATDFNQSETQARDSDHPEPQPEVAKVEPRRANEGLEEPDRPIPFPWSPSPSRPQRIPPRTRPVASEPAAPAANVPEPPVTAPPVPLKPAELTAEELSALMGKPVAPEKHTREGRA